MKILHTSDWHLGQSFYNFNREEEFREFFRQLRTIIREEKPDAMLVSGDIFDVATPSNAIVTMYNKELLKIQQENEGLQTIITAGNHDSPSRLSSAGILWKEFGVTVIGSPTRKDGEIDMQQMIVPIYKNKQISGWVLAVPYMHSSSYPAAENDCYSERVRSFYNKLFDIADEMRSSGQPIIAMGHLTLTNSDLTGHNTTIGMMDSVPVDIWNDGIAYVALGHIHHAQHVGPDNVRYSGSILPMSFDENYQHSVTIVEFENEQMSTLRKIEIKPPIAVCTIPKEAAPFEKVKEALSNYSDDEPAYLRANILSEGVMPADMFDEACSCLKDKTKLRLCTLLQVRKQQAATEEESNMIHSLDELRKISPIEVAKRSYKIKRQEEMPEELIVCMKEAIEGASTEAKEDER